MPCCVRRAGSSQSRPAWLAAIALVCLAVYGVVVGPFSGHEQLWAAPLKITAGLFISGVICLPSLYIFACLSGASAKVGQIAGLLVGLMALVGVFLLMVLQMSTALRLILGRAPTLLPVEKRFFLAHWSDCLSAKDTPPQAVE